MKCSYHPAAEAKDFCSTCSKPLCSECAHQIKGKTYCQDCLVRGAEWAAAIKDLRVPENAPKRAALLSVIPGMGAVYNGEYLKAITFFAVFAALVIMGDRVHGVFGFGAFAFVIFTIFDSYRTAASNMRLQVQTQSLPAQRSKDRSLAAWGFFLMALGVVLLLQNIIPYYILNRLWPLVFILLGGYLVYIAMRDKEDRSSGGQVFSEKKESL